MQSQRDSAVKVYLDACCLCRPFDDQNVDRNRVEAEAILTILRRMERGEWSLVGSEVLHAELDSVQISANAASLRVVVKNPLTWLAEQLDADTGNDIK